MRARMPQRPRSGARGQQMLGYKSARRIQVPSPAATARPRRIIGTESVPNSSSQKMKTTMAVKMPPIREGKARLTWACGTVCALRSIASDREPRIGGSVARPLQVAPDKAAVIAIEDVTQQAAV